MRGYCPILQTCPFFNDQMVDMPASSQILKAAYCKDDYTECARYRVYGSLGRPAVPSNLFPSELERARILIAKGVPSAAAPGGPGPEGT